MSEFITIQVGQCGNQIGSVFWPFVLQEYGVEGVPDGVRNLNSNFKSHAKLQTSFQSFFYVPPKTKCTVFKNLPQIVESKVKARAVLIDMEDSVLARYRNGPFSSLFDRKCIVANYPGSGNNWAEGFYCHGPKYKDIILNSITRAVEKCDHLHGFLLMFSVGGGTGSGLGSFVLKLLADYFPSVDRFVTCVYPIGTEDVITCPYNMTLATKFLTEHASCVFPVENRTLLEIVERQMNNKHSSDTVNYVYGCKPYQDMNTVIVNMLLHLTSGARFSGRLNVDINEINTNMVPFPKLNFLASSFSPQTVNSFKTVKDTSSVKIKDDLFVTSTHRNNHLLKIDSLSKNSVLLSVALIGRGNFTVSDMRKYTEKIQHKAQFTAWSSKAMKIGLCDIPPAGHSAGMLSLFNTTAMNYLFQEIINKFKKLYNRKAHIHHYTDVSGFEHNCFEESFESVTSTIESYEEIMRLKPLAVPRLTPKSILSL